MLFFAAVLVTSLAAGIGPGICAIVISVPLETLHVRDARRLILCFKRPFRGCCLRSTG